MKTLIPYSLRKKIRYIIDSDYRNEILWQRQMDKELIRISKLPRFALGRTNLFEKQFIFDDGYAFVSSYNEIIINENYSFHSITENPLIIDCGANIGLSIYYFKKKFPNATIIAFEPDPKLFLILENNIAAFNFSDVQLYQKAVWNENTIINFNSTGGVSGRIGKIETKVDEAHQILVEAINLTNYLNREVDFLKLDIEGAEIEVLDSCYDSLFNIKKLFVEYHSVSSKIQQLDKLLNILSSAGFRYQIKDVFSAKKPFFDGPELINSRLFDLQLEIYAYRIG